MIDPTSLAARAYDHIHTLAVTIGPRLAGSQAEQRARDYIEDQLKAWGYQVTQQSVAFAPAGLSWPYVLAGVALFIAGWCLPFFPWLALLLLPVFVALPQVSLWATRRRPRTSTSENLIARHVRFENQSPTLILCAHMDSAPASRIDNRTWRKLHSRSMDIIQRIVIFLAIMAAISLLGFSLAGIPWLLAGSLGSLAGGWLLIAEGWAYLPKAGHDSPGANDNASGVGILLALAEQLAQNTATLSRPIFLFTTAEETGLHGAEVFAKAWKSYNQPIRCLVLDMVGAGDRLRFVSKDGILFPLHTDSQLNQRFQAAIPQARPLWHTLRSSDARVFMEQSFATAALQTSGSEDAELAYHTRFDTIEYIELIALENTLQALSAVL